MPSYLFPILSISLSNALLAAEFDIQLSLPDRALYAVDAFIVRIDVTNRGDEVALLPPILRAGHNTIVEYCLDDDLVPDDESIKGIHSKVQLKVGGPKRKLAPSERISAFACVWRDRD